MADLNDFNYVDDSDDVMAVDVNNLVASSLRSEYKNVETLSATRTLLDVDTPIQRFDCNGANRIVKMPTADAVENHLFLIVNSTASGTYTLTVQNNGGTVNLAVLNPSEFVLVVPDGNGGYLAINKPFSVVVSPSQITSNQNNYNPTGAGSADVLRLTSDASRDITGLAFPAGAKTILIHNVGSNDIVLKDESASSTAANRFALSADVTLTGDQSVMLWYDATSSRWRVVGGTSDSGGGGDSSGGGGEGILVNGIISVSVASNDLTVAIKTLAGADPSVGDPVSIQIGGVVRQITSALSVTKNDGTNWCNAGSSELATKLIQYFVYIGYNATDGVTIGFSRIPYARAYSDFSTTTTNEKYCAISTITNAASTDKYVIVGRFSATLSAGAGYTWSISGTGDVVNYPIFETDILSWQPSYSATVSMTYSSVTTSVAEYRVCGRRFELELITLGTTGGTAAPGIRATMPFAARNYANVVPGSGWTADGAGTIASCIFIDSVTANLLTCRRYDGANYGLGTNRYIAFNGGFYL